MVNGFDRHPRGPHGSRDILHVDLDREPCVRRLPVFSILLVGLKQRALKLSKRSDAKRVHWCFENVTVVDKSLMKGNNYRP